MGIGLRASARQLLRGYLPLPVLRATRLHIKLRRVHFYESEGSFADERVDVRALPLYRREYFPDSGPTPWLDRDDALEQIEKRLEAGEITARQAKWCRDYSKDGYLILEGFHDGRFLDGVWDAVQEGIRSGQVPTESSAADGRYSDRIQDAHLYVPELRRHLDDARTLDVLSLLLGRQIRPFQTLMFNRGSEQLEHSDSIHMTTYPEGYLAATWTAVEDVTADAGPLVYYPGSHKLPYLLSEECGLTEREALGESYDFYREKYEPAIQQRIKERGFERKVFLPKKGDLLIWHANLIHGGTKRESPTATRKSIVCHYFARGAICYHDMFGALARA